MTTQSRPSKNRRRKDRRHRYHALGNALSRQPEDAALMQALGELKEQYFRSVDRQIDNIGAFADADSTGDEKAFIREILRVVEEKGWVTVYTANAGDIQMRSDVHEYIDARLASGRSGRGPRSAAQRAAAAQHLCERAIASIRPRHP